MRILLDINVVLDVFLNRPQFVAEAAAVFRANHEGRVVAHLSAASLPTIFYIVRRNAGLEQARSVLRECVATFEIVSVGRTTVDLACTLPGSDFEDNLQIAAGMEANVGAIVTRDPTHYAHSPVIALTPSQLIGQIGERPEPPPRVLP